ncbi:hypothetical protein JHK87_001739 [Glycine soja]|nr:hypothetical protein JHK87_001739 [Glycine soja]
MICLQDFVSEELRSKYDRIFPGLLPSADDLGDDSIFDGRKTVCVLNGMNDDILVYLQCQSRYNDLGQHVLAVGEYQEWSFRDNIRDTTLFWCTMDAGKVHASFQVYRAEIEEKLCDSQCNRTLTNDGGYFYDQFHGYWEKRLSWYIP